jgi:hypothetical protein
MSLPESIGKLTSLTELHCFNIQLSELPKSFGLLTSLTILNCSDNQLMSLPDSICDLTSLTYLDCVGNQLTELPESFGLLTSLIYLDCVGNQLTELPESFGLLTSLTALYCYDNKLTKMPKSINDIPNLQINCDQHVVVPIRLLKIPDTIVDIKEYTCQVCLEDDPKNCNSVGIRLPCQHTICLIGLTYWIATNKSQKCCICQKEYKLVDCRKVNLI